MPCNVVEKTRAKAEGLVRADLNVASWYDYGDGTPIPISYEEELENTAIPGNRIVVEAGYRFDFIVPFAAALAPDGIYVKMRSARTILNRGDDPSYGCTVS